MKRVLFVILCIISLSSQAHDFSTMECQAFARDIAFIASMRETEKQEDIVAKLMPMMVAYKGNPDSYIHDDDDIAVMLGVVALIYKYLDTDPATLRILTFDACTGTSIEC